LTHGVNAGVMRAHTHGTVTSASLIAAGPATFAAIALARSLPALDIGCHIVLIKAEGLQPLHAPPSLAFRANGHPARLRYNQIGLSLAVMRGGVRVSHLVEEGVRQVKVLQDAGINVTHLDTHGHTHALPQVLDALIVIAQRCGVPALRNPYDPLR